MGVRSGNPTWENYPSTATPVNAARLNAIETALDSFSGSFGEVRSAVNAGGTYSYIGVAPVDTAEGTAAWNIARITLTGTVGVTTRAVLTSWTGREAGSYS